MNNTKSMDILIHVDGWMGGYDRVPRTQDAQASGPLRTDASVQLLYV